MSSHLENGNGFQSRGRNSTAATSTNRWWGLITALAGCLLLAACATQPYVDPLAPIGVSPWALGSGDTGGVDRVGDIRANTPAMTPALPPEWIHLKLTGKQTNDYTAVLKDGRHAVRAKSDASVSLLRQKVRIPAEQLQSVKFSWNVPALLAKADMAQRHTDDSPVRIVLAFEGDRSRFSTKNALLSELSHTLTGEPLPYATLMYVWCNTRAPGSVIVNPRSDRIRKIVVETGARNLNQWRDYERDIRADYTKAFGEAPGALVGIGIMTDSDNTRSTTRAWYGGISLAGN